MDYVVNTRAIIALFYVGTGILNIGSVNSALGIECGENWERTFSKYSPIVCKIILKVVNDVIGEALKKEIAITIA